MQKLNKNEKKTGFLAEVRRTKAGLQQVEKHITNLVNKYTSGIM